MIIFTGKLDEKNDGEINHTNISYVLSGFVNISFFFKSKTFSSLFLVGAFFDLTSHRSVQVS